MMEEENETTYEPLGKGKRAVDEPDDDEPKIAPKDTRNFVYLSLLSAGIGFVLPYNSVLSAADYWLDRFPGKSVALDLSSTYILVAFVTVLANNILLAVIPFKVRIAFGYAVSFTTLIFIAVCEVGYHVFSKTTAYSVCLVAVSFVSVGCTIQQSSFYGFASIFPKQYTQAVMAGESLAGLLVSANRILTKLLITNERISTVIFFFTSVIYIAFSYILHIISLDTPFVRYYRNYTKKASKIVLVPDESQYSPEAAGQNATSSTGLSFRNPVYDVSFHQPNTEHLRDSQFDVPNVAFKVEHDMGSSRPRLGSLRYGLSRRWVVARAIYPYMASIALAYCVTLSLYPGIESEIISCTLRTWMPVLLMFTFNAADVLGKVLSAIPYVYTRRQLILLSTLRVLIVPLLLLCCAPRESPIIAGETAAFIFTAAFGLTNGLAGSLPMILAPLKVPTTLKEIAGNMMTLSYNIGLATGALIGYVFDSMLGEQTDISKFCPIFPYIPSDRPTMTTVISTSAAVIAANLTTTTISTTLRPFTTTLTTPLTTSTPSTTHFMFESTTFVPDNFTDLTELVLLTTSGA